MMKEALRQHIEQLVKLTDEEWDLVSQRFTEKKFRKHQYIIQQGDRVASEYWVVKGLLKAYSIDDKGKEHILQFPMEGWWTSDYNAFQNQLTASIFIECLEETEVLVLSLGDRELICREVHAMANFFRLKANYGYIALQQRILSLLNSSAEERYNSLLDRYPQLFQRVPKKLLAAYLGVSRETLSRLGLRSRK